MDLVGQYVSILLDELVAEFNVWVYAHSPAPNKDLVVSGQCQAMVHTTLQVFCKDFTIG